jgi:hypothetical protein
MYEAVPELGHIGNKAGYEVVMRKEDPALGERSLVVQPIV